MFKDFDVDCWNWVMLADMGDDTDEWQMLIEGMMVEGGEEKCSGIG